MRPRARYEVHGIDAPGFEGAPEKDSYGTICPSIVLSVLITLLTIRSFRDKDKGYHYHDRGYENREKRCAIQFVFI